MSAPFQIYFVTKCVEVGARSGRPFGGRDRDPTSLAHVCRQGQIKLLAFVVMPDHYHAVFSLRPGQNLSDLMRRIGSYTAGYSASAARWTSATRSGKTTASMIAPCRNDEEVLDAVEYVHDNPVRKGLIALPEELPFFKRRDPRSRR